MASLMSTSSDCSKLAECVISQPSLLSPALPHSPALSNLCKCKVDVNSVPLLRKTTIQFWRMMRIVGKLKMIWGWINWEKKRNNVWVPTPCYHWVPVGFLSVWAHPIIQSLLMCSVSGGWEHYEAQHTWHRSRGCGELYIQLLPYMPICWLQMDRYYQQLICLTFLCNDLCKHLQLLHAQVPVKQIHHRFSL